MWSVGVILLLSAYTMTMLSTSLTSETALMLLMENMKMEHDSATLILGIGGFLVTLFSVSAARAVDQLVTPQLALIAAIVTLFARTSLAFNVTFRTPYTDIAIVPLIIFIMALDSVLVLQAITLCLDNQIKRSFIVLVTGVTTDEYRTAQSARVFGVQYSLLNGAAFVSTVGYGLLRDYVATAATANALAQWFGLFANMLTVSLLLLSLGVHFTPFSQQQHNTEDNRDSLWTILRTAQLWRFVLFCLLIVGVSSILRHMILTLPIVMQRQFTDKVNFAYVQAINPFIIVFIAWIVQWLTARRRSYWVITSGTILSSLSLLCLVIAGGQAQHRAANGIVDYLPYILFMLIFSVGEAIWSARYTSYILQVTPPNHKALYMAIAAIPQMGARLLVAIHSAWLMNLYCPSPAHCSPRDIWTPIWLLSCMTPVGLILGFHWLDSSSSSSSSLASLPLLSEEE